MQLLSSRPENRRARKLRIVLAVVLIPAVITAWFGYQPALNRYRIWKQQRALGQARQLLAEQDFPGAKLALDVALAAVPGNPEALRVAVGLLEQVGAPQALTLRRRLVQQAPDSVEDRAALVTSALRFRDLNAARDALSEMTPEQAGRPVALKAALAYALVTGNKPVADALYDRLRQSEPANGNLRVMHAILRRQSPDAAVAAAARAELGVLAQDPRHTLFIHRELMVDAMARRDYAEARRLAALVAADPRATFADRLHQANLALTVDRRPFAEVFAALAPAAGGDAAAAAEFIRWLLVVGHPAEAERWRATLSPALQSAPGVVAVQADLVAAAQDWDRLALLLENGAWGAVNRDTVRLAFSTRLAADRRNESLQRQLWDEAISAAGRSLPDLRLLHRLASLWQWPVAIERTLWAIVRSQPGEAWAHQTLFDVYRGRKDTENMRALIGTLRELDATIPRYHYDWALLTLLTFRTPNWTPAKQTMHDLYTADPANAFFATGYAFALAQSDKGAEALAVVGKLSAEALALPARGPYLAYIYGVNRLQPEYEKAAAVLPRLTRLLPEERELFVQGRDALTRPVPRKVPAAASRLPDKGEAKPESGG